MTKNFGILAQITVLKNRNESTTAMIWTEIWKCIIWSKKRLLGLLKNLKSLLLTISIDSVIRMLNILIETLIWNGCSNSSFSCWKIIGSVLLSIRITANESPRKNRSNVLFWNGQVNIFGLVFTKYTYNNKPWKV